MKIFSILDGTEEALGCGASWSSSYCTLKIIQDNIRTIATLKKKDFPDWKIFFPKRRQRKWLKTWGIMKPVWNSPLPSLFSYPISTPADTKAVDNGVRHGDSWNYTHFFVFKIIIKIKLQDVHLYWFLPKDLAIRRKYMVLSCRVGSHRSWEGL